MNRMLSVQSWSHLKKRYDMFLVKSFANDPIFQKLISSHFERFQEEELTQKHIKTFVSKILINNFTLLYKFLYLNILLDGKFWNSRHVRIPENG